MASRAVSLKTTFLQPSSYGLYCRMTDSAPTPSADNDPYYDPPDFDPVPVQYRHHGWSAERQVLFIRTLAETGTVADACREVGMSERSAYKLRDRMDAVSFRNAWDHASDFAVRRLADVKLSHAINGVAVPVFYQGQQVGERRVFNDQLAMFILRTRGRERYGKWLENERTDRHPEHAAFAFSRAIIEVEIDAELPKGEAIDRMQLRIEALFGKKTIDNRDLFKDNEEPGGQDDFPRGVS